MKNIFYSLIIILTIALSIPGQIFVREMSSESGLSDIKTAKAAIDNPVSFQVSVRDHNCTDQEGYSSSIGPGSYGTATDTNAKDPDCGRININPGSVSSTPQNQTIYNNDFRLGVQLLESINSSPCDPNNTRDGGSIQYTPWASEGGGASWGAVAQPNINDPDCLRIYYETRALPINILIKDVRAGLSTGHGSTTYTPWARSGGGWSNSGGNRAGGGYSGGGNISPARVVLDVQLVEVYDAEYVSDTIPASVQPGETGNYSITMKNKASTWLSDVTYPSPDSCETQTPADVGLSCDANVDAYSTKVKLKRIDADTDITISSIPPPSVSTSTSQYEYKRSILRNYISSNYCTSFAYNSDPNQDRFSFIDKIIKTANAAIRAPGDGDPDPDTGPSCTSWGVRYGLAGQSPVNSHITNTNNAEFPVAIQIGAGATPGVHTLRFKMLKIVDGTVFGSEAEIQVTVATNAWSFSCETPVQIVQRGQTANYTLRATVPGGYTTPINVTLFSTNPPGLTTTPSPLVAITPSPLVLTNSTNPVYRGSVAIDTASLDQPTYTLRFQATDGAQTYTCDSSLDVTPLLPEVYLYFDGATGTTQPTPSNGSTGELSWDTVNASTCTSTMDSPTIDTSIPVWSNGPNNRATANFNEGTQYFTVNNMSQSSSYIFRLTCSSLYGETASKAVTVNVGPADPPVIVSFECMGDSDKNPQTGPCHIPYDGQALLYWDSQNANFCDITPASFGDFPPIGTSETKGMPTPQLTSNRTYTLTCNNTTGQEATASLEIIVDSTPSFTVTCSPNSYTVAQGDVVVFAIDTAPYDGFNSEVTFSETITGGGAVKPTVDYGKTNNQIPSATTLATVSTTTSTSPGTYTIIFSGTGGGVGPITCTRSLVVNPIDPPEAPINVDTDNFTTCGVINVTWTVGTGAVPETFEVYRTTVKGGKWNSISGSIPYIGGQSNYNFVDSSPAVSNNYYAVRAFIGASASSYAEPVVTPVAVDVCAPDLSTSDKDLIKVNTNTVGSSAVICNIDSDIFRLPNNNVFKEGDEVTFQINVCNSGNQPLTNITVVDTVLNLTNLQNISTDPCVTGFNGTNTFTLADLPAPPPGIIAGTSVCSIKIKATISSSGGPAGQLYRFQNTAQINSTQASFKTSTPPYLFSVGSGVPTRTETAP